VFAGPCVRFFIFGAILCSPAAAWAHGPGGAAGGGVPGVAGHAAFAHPPVARPNVSLPLGTRARSVEAGTRGTEGATPARLIDGNSNQRGIDAAPSPKASPEYDPLKRRHLALPAPAPGQQADAGF
jgi:hypothetical protein